MARLTVEISDAHKQEYERKCIQLGLTMTEDIKYHISTVTGIPVEPNKKPGRKRK